MSLPRTVGRYRLLRELGAGMYGTVYLGEDSLDDRRVAIKKLNEADYGALAKEIDVLQTIRGHPHVINYLGTFFHHHRAYIVMELAERGELYDFIVDGLREDIARYYFHQIVSAVEHLHSLHVCHRDLKPENILLNREYDIKVTDFGLAKPMVHQALMTMCGSPCYVAPEIFLGEGYDGAKADTWSLGVILLAMITATLPVQDQAIRGDPLFDRILSRVYDYDPWGSTLVGEAEELCKLMLEPNPDRRIALKDVKEHPWYTGPLPSPEEARGYMERQLHGLPQPVVPEPAPGVFRSGSDVVVDDDEDQVIGSLEACDLPPLDENTPLRATSLFGGAQSDAQFMQQIADTLTAAGCDVTLQQAKAKLTATRGPLIARVNFYRRAQGCVAEFTKHKGDVLAFKRFFGEISKQAHARG